jgi:type IV pilus assembly protein PilM
MSFFANLLKDPPPTHVFELSEEGIAYARVAEPGELGFASLEPGTLQVSPLHDNIQQPFNLQERLRNIIAPNGHRRRGAALILPDYCARIAVLDFDAFPEEREEQLALLRFRMKKSVPFDIESALVGFTMQPRRAAAEGPGKIEVLAAVIAAEIVGRYEAPFRTLGFQPGFVTTSSLAAVNLLEPQGVTMLVKLSGRILSALVLEQSNVKLARCVEMDARELEEIESVLHPTLAYIEDELKSPPKQIWLSGFGPQAGAVAARWQGEWRVPVEPLRSRFGTPDQNNSGLLGYLESVAG